MATSCVTEAPVYGPVQEPPAWDAGVALDTLFTGDLYAVFTSLNTTLGAVAGINDVDESVHFSDVEYGFMFSKGQVRIVERGVYVGPSWSPYNSDDTFIIYRYGDTVYYLRGVQSSYDTAVYYDDALPGIPLPGQVMYTSQVPAYYPMIIDISLFAITDKVCILASGINWADESAAVDFFSSLEGEITFGNDANAPIGSDVGTVIVGEFPLSISATGSAAEGVANGTITFDAFISDTVKDILTGEITFTGTYNGQVGTSSVYDPVVSSYTALQGTLSFGILASGEEDIPTGVFAGELPFFVDGVGSELINIDYTSALTGELPFYGVAAGTEGAGQNIRAGAIQGEISFPIYAAGTSGVTEAEAALSGSLDFVISATGSIYPEVEAIDQKLEGELPFQIYATASRVSVNSLDIILPELGSFSSVLTSVELTDEIRALSEMQAQYVILVNEFISLVTEPRTFSQQSVELLDTAYAVATALPQFSIWVQETLGITDTDKLTVVQVIELAEALQAASMVQTVYQGTVAVLSAILITDGGAGADPVGSGAILDATGVSGDPAEIALYGWFPTGSVLGISYTTNVGGGGSVSYTLTQHQTGEQVAERLVALLNAEPYLSSTYAGSGVVQILPANGATVVNI